jgi:hypothetical protein
MSGEFERKLLEYQKIVAVMAQPREKPMALKELGKP